MQTFNVKSFRSKFPILSQKLNNETFVYFDNAATTQKPTCVIEQYQAYYQEYNANVHRASHQLSATSTAAFEEARKCVKQFINAKYTEEVIWTKGTTEGINLLAHSLGQLVLNSGDEIILSQSEHHANIVPWQLIAEQKSAVIKVVPLTDEGTIDIQALKLLISPHTKIMSFAHISNVVGKVNPVAEVIELCKQHDVITIVDGAQAIAHQHVDVQKLDCDFYLFSAHKMYGPTGVGVLYGKRNLLTRMPPYQGGGEMISKVSFKKTSYNVLPFKFEAGTPNIAGIIAFGTAVNFFVKTGMSCIFAYEEKLIDYCFSELIKIKPLIFITQGKPSIPLFSFVIEGLHNHDVASFLDANNIAVRAGHHCAMPLMEYLKRDGCIRVALSPYNTIEEVDYLIQALKRAIKSSTTTVVPADNIAHCNESTAITSEMIIGQFSSLKGWDSRHREIMLLGKSHARISAELLIDENLIQGCESKAWLTYEKVNNRYYFKADSDAKVIRGLLTIVLAAYHTKTAQDILTFDINKYFSELGLIQHLSPSRANGLLAIVERIKSIASELR